MAWELPTTPIFRIDSDTTGTQKQALNEATKWLETPGGVLVGTEMALPFLKPTENVVVASVDSLFSVPDFRINEKIFHILLTLRSLAKKTFLVQTRNPEQRVLALALEGDVDVFYEHEIQERERFDYPPFHTLIKLSIRGSKNTVEKASNHVTEIFREYKPIVYPSFVSRINRAHVAHVLLSVPRGQWVDKTLLGKLRRLPPSITIDVEPQSTL